MDDCFYLWVLCGPVVFYLTVDSSYVILLLVCTCCLGGFLLVYLTWSASTVFWLPLQNKSTKLQQIPFKVFIRVPSLSKTTLKIHWKVCELRMWMWQAKMIYHKEFFFINGIQHKASIIFNVMDASSFTLLADKVI